MAVRQIIILIDDSGTETKPLSMSITDENGREEFDNQTASAVQKRVTKAVGRAVRSLR